MESKYLRMISSDPRNATARKLHSHKIATALFVPPPASTKDASRGEAERETGKNGSGSRLLWL